jgi:chromosome partitioning protein
MELNQTVISKLAGFNRAYISRFVASNNISTVFDGGKSKRYSVENTRKIMKGLCELSKKTVTKKVQVFYNFKGGTGKTSLCYQMATHLTLMGYDVLAIDLDPQGHLSTSMIGEKSIDLPTMYDVLVNSLPIQDAVSHVCEGLDLIPGNLALTRLEIQLSQKTKREEVLKRTISPVVDSYDFVLIDTNPTISILNMNALAASDHVNVVCETQPYSLSGLGLLVEELKSFGDEMEKSLSYHIIANKYESKTASAQEVLGALRADYKEHMFESVIRKSEDVNIASKIRLPVSAFASKRSLAFEDIIDLLHEFLQKFTASPKDLLGQPIVD